MKNKKLFPTLLSIDIILIVAAVFFGGLFENIIVGDMLLIAILLTAVLILWKVIKW